MYYEDIEFCLRSKKYEIKCAWSPESIIYHKDGKTTKNIYNTNTIDYISLRNRIILAKYYFAYSLPFISIVYLLIPIKRLFFGGDINLSNIARALIIGVLNK